MKGNDDLPDGMSNLSSSNHDEFGASSRARPTMEGESMNRMKNATPIPNNMLNEFEKHYTTLEPMNQMPSESGRSTPDPEMLLQHPKAKKAVPDEGAQNGSFFPTIQKSPNPKKTIPMHTMSNFQEQNYDNSIEQ